MSDVLPPPPRQPRSRRRRFLFVAAIVVIGWGVVEAASFAVLKFVYNETPNTLQQMRDRQDDEASVIARMSEEVIHPYLGYVTDPSRLDGFNEHGFPERDAIFQSRSDDKLIVAVFGGSVAMFQSTEESDSLRTAIAAKFPKRDISIVCLAAGGYRQPQQLMTLTYMLSLGAEFDVVINLDGFNEVALESGENETRFKYFAYPRRWATRIGPQTDPETARLASRLRDLERSRVAMRRLVGRRPLRWLPSANLAWRSTAAANIDERTKLQTQLQQVELSADAPYAQVGPPNPPETRAAFEEKQSFDPRVVRLWADCSRQMSKLCAANDMTYVHVLQPNLYDESGKDYTAEITAGVKAEEHRYKAGVVGGYPALKHAGQDLRADGVRFFDLSAVFRDVSELTYIDDCCHLNPLGISLLSQAIAEVVATSVDSE